MYQNHQIVTAVNKFGLKKCQMAYNERKILQFSYM